jgi:hypothetical protein
LECWPNGKGKKFLPQMSDVLNSFGRRRRKAHSKKHVLSEAPVSGKMYRYTGIYRYKIFVKIPVKYRYLAKKYRYPVYRIQCGHP